MGLPGGCGKETACSAGDDVRSLSQEDPLEEEMATHSSILAWEIPWTEEPCGHSIWGGLTLTSVNDYLKNHSFDHTDLCW